jgi:hypothetical protein
MNAGQRAGDGSAPSLRRAQQPSIVSLNRVAADCRRGDFMGDRPDSVNYGVGEWIMHATRLEGPRRGSRDLDECIIRG